MADTTIISLLQGDLSSRHIHFVGIKGTGMAALVEILHSRGANITGSDVPDTFYTDSILEKLHIKVYTEFSEKNISENVSLVIYSSAYNKDKNPDLCEAQRRNIPIVLYSDALGAISGTTYSCGIAGVHGKTTTTGLTGTLIKACDLPAQVLAGSLIPSFTSDSAGSCTISLGHDFFVAETCEYQRHFMSFHPQKIILTSVEPDHQDYYPEFKDIQNAFIDYISLLPEGGEVFYCADDVGACDTITKILQTRSDITAIPYGEKAEGSYAITSITIEDGMQKFKLAGFDIIFSLNLPGKHTVLDSVAAIALTISLYKDYCKSKQGDFSLSHLLPKIQNGLFAYKGSKRRSEIIGKTDSIIFIDDYGHHPTAIKTTLAGYKAFYKDYLLVVDFMSHTYSRTAALLEDFAASFSSADKVFLHKIYASARETYDGSVTGELLAEHTKKYHQAVTYIPEVLDAFEEIKNILEKELPQDKKGYVFVSMGAGDNWKLGKKLYEYFSSVNKSKS
ncbi:MAG: UDP-N-acetylmuramate--L-alanine ligase [Spirochaetaceae bacterium]|nr:UDP-N-acetylmuramate--L-alanine ligase [Spirochaetaceae bacterium]